jgi:hypothetical protein
MLGQKNPFYSIQIFRDQSLGINHKSNLTLIVPLFVLSEWDSLFGIGEIY